MADRGTRGTLGGHTQHLYARVGGRFLPVLALVPMALDFSPQHDRKHMITFAWLTRIKYLDESQRSFMLEMFNGKLQNFIAFHEKDDG